MQSLQIGLIGANIGNSRAPVLYRVAGELAGIDVRYQLLDLESADGVWLAGGAGSSASLSMAERFEAAYTFCQRNGFRGLNVTHPVKELAAARVRVDDPAVRAIGAVNTVCFDPVSDAASGHDPGTSGPPPVDQPHPGAPGVDGPAAPMARGHNTDHSGFIRAYTSARGMRPPGVVAVLGAGGVGRAVVFGLLRLGAREVRLYDVDAARARRLAEQASAALGDGRVVVSGDPETACDGVNGLANCTALGMHGHPGMAVEPALIGRPDWGFEAVYTPVRTPFSDALQGAGAQLIGGFELFFHQGVDALRWLCGIEVDPATLRAALLATPEVEALFAGS